MDCKEDYGRLFDECRDYHYVRRLGEGSFGDVVLVDDSQGNEFAVKCLPPGRRLPCEYVVQEILIHKKLNHPHIIEFKEIFNLGRYLCIVMEYAPGGSLKDLLRAIQGPLDGVRVRHYFQQLIMAIDYCHFNGITHGDIKVENILVDEEGVLIKLSDFGCAANDTGRRPLSNHIAGTPNYMAPEALMYYHTGNYCKKMADVWACGVALYVMTTCRLPFRPIGIVRDDSEQRTFARILAVDYRMPESISPLLRDLFSKIFVRDPNERITIEEIKEHSYFTSNLPIGALELTAEWSDKRLYTLQPSYRIIDIVRESEDPTES